MGIRLDWESDSPSSGKKSGGSYVAREDPENKRARSKARIRALVLFIVAALIFVGAGAIVAWRLNQANAFIESLLRDTVEAEFAALRLGDWNAYSGIQRSATDDWLVQQRGVFEIFQAEKISNAVDLSGTVRDLEIDGTRGRVIVEWKRDGVPMSQAWFYWRYEDTEDAEGTVLPGGWRHVPPDLTFWGTTVESKGSLVTTIYRDVDEALASDMKSRVEGWINSICGPVLQCGDLPHITLDIRADFYLSTSWDNTQHWRLLIPSPFIDGGRADTPFSGETLVTVADAIATRLVAVSLGTTAAFDAKTDAGYVFSASREWLFGYLTGLNMQSSVIDSLVAQRGATAVGSLLKSLTPESTLDVVLTAFETQNPSDAAIDWRDFLRARIQLESDYITQGDSNAVAQLYISEMQSRALERSQAAAAQNGIEVRLVQSVQAPDGSPALIASVIFGAGAEAREELVYFYWRGGTWLRAS